MSKLNMFLMLGIVMVLSLAVGSAAYLPQEQNKELNLIVQSNNATQCNVTYVQYPDGTTTLLNTNMTKQGTTYSLLFGSNYFSKLGSTCIGVSCTDGATQETGSICREVTPNGEETNGWKITLQIFISISTLLLALLFMYLSGAGIKTNMAKDESGPAKFFFLGIALVFLIAHIIITNVIIHETLGIGVISSAYTSVMYIFFTIIILLFLYTLVKVMVWEIDIIMRRKGLKA